MEVKKTQQVAAPVAAKDTSFSTRHVRDFIGDVKEELKKITWTSPEELKVYTKIVVGATFLFGMGIYFMDLFIQGFLNGVAMALRLIFG